MSTREFSASDLIGSVIDGRFEVMEKLGEGGMGAIYKARQLSMERLVALKILLRNRRGDPISVERFRHEAYLASRLRHPNAVVIYDFGQSGDGLLYIAMELLTGQNLKDRLRAAGPLSVVKAVRIIRQNLRPISQAHRMGLIHRDLKPANIFLTTVEGNPDFVKVLDFGVAKLTAVHDRVTEGYQGGLTVAGKIYGTPNYMSPEQIRGKELNNQSDLYSLGVILYEMLCGRRPFEADTPVDVMMMHLRDDAPPLREFRNDLPSGLEDVLRTALAKERTDRFKNGEEFLEALEPFRSGASAEHTSFSVDMSISEVGGSRSRIQSAQAQDPEPVLSGLDMSVDGLESLLDGLNEEKTVLDNVDLDDDDDHGLGLDGMDENTVFEHIEHLKVGSVNSSNLLDSVDKIPDRRPREDSVAPSGMSVLELGSSEFERLDPSRLVDIPVLDELERSHQGNEQRPSTIAGGPVPSLASHLQSLKSPEKPPKKERPSFPSSRAPQPAPVVPKPVQKQPIQANMLGANAQPEVRRVAPSPFRETARLGSQIVQEGPAVPKRQGGTALPTPAAPLRQGATAFELPPDARNKRMRRAAPKKRSWKKIVLGLVVLTALGATAALVLPKMLKSTPPPPKPGLHVVLATPQIEVLLDNRFVTGGKHYPFSGPAAPHEIRVMGKKGSVKLMTGKIDQPFWLYVQLSANGAVQEIGKQLISGEKSGLDVYVADKKVGQTPIIFVGEKGRVWKLRIAGKESEVRIQ